MRQRVAIIFSAIGRCVRCAHWNTKLIMINFLFSFLFLSSTEMHRNGTKLIWILISAPLPSSGWYPISKVRVERMLITMSLLNGVTCVCRWNSLYNSTTDTGAFYRQFGASSERFVLFLHKQRPTQTISFWCAHVERTTLQFIIIIIWRFGVRSSNQFSSYPSTVHR